MMNNKNNLKKILKKISFLLIYISVIFLAFFEFSWFTFILTDMEIQPSNIDFALYYIFVPMRTLITGVIAIVPNFKTLNNLLVISGYMIVEVLWTTLLFFGTRKYMGNYFGSSIFAASSLAFICNLALLIALCIKFYMLYKELNMNK